MKNIFLTALQVLILVLSAATLYSAEPERGKDLPGNNKKGIVFDACGKEKDKGCQKDGKKVIKGKKYYSGKPDKTVN